MKLIKSLMFMLLLSSAACAQPVSESDKFLQDALSQPNLSRDELLPKFTAFDFSDIWMKNNSAVLGFIGDNYQRLNVKYLTIIKNSEKPAVYYVNGKSRVKNNVCQFMGKIEIIHIRKIEDPDKEQYYEAAKKNNDEEAMARFSKREYVLLARYTFFEDPNQHGSGVFEGVLKSNFYMDNGKIYYDDLNRESDGFSNNQCVGSWTSYASNVVKKCNWGEYRIPDSGDLDVGAGEFSPNEKYLENGWTNYKDALKKENW
ncbi:hypothetical protein [Prolixibacter sp. NT017]|uniref:hypothetical protein n=1 Tax=Prolixibacter sp. NT017 TaxID=2652390 RepID=UPI0012993C5B|nr:hypothetical protein [Prolixibacter sp. NT017]